MQTKKVIAVIDDEQINHTILKGLLSDRYKITSYLSSDLFYDSIKHQLPDLILLDIVMPKSDGYETIMEIKKSIPHKTIPIIFLTSKTDSFDEAKGFQLGAVDYITKPFTPVILIERIKLHLKLVEIQNKLTAQNNSLNKQVEDRIHEYNLIQDISLNVIAQIVEKRDLETGNHILRTKLFFQIIADELKENSIYKDLLQDIDVKQWAKACILHDIGKVAIPDLILNKPSSLDKTEWEIMKQHPLYGYQVIQSALNHINNEEVINTLELNNLNEFFKNASDIALYHHEKWNGEGYPSNLSKEEIPLSARIMAVVDVFDALSSKRVYKEAWELERVLLLLAAEKNKHFDPIVVEALCSKLEDIKIVVQKYQDLNDK